MDITPITRAFHRKVLVAKKNSPHIFFAAGIVGSVASTVLACRATLRLNETMDEISKDINDVKNMHTIEDIDPFSNRYPIEYQSRDLAYVYAKSSLKLAKLYAPSAALGVFSIGLLTGSHVQLTKRNTAVMAAYAAVQKAYDDYRERVQEILGEEKELEVYHAASVEKGNKQDARLADPNKWSPYAKFFDEASPYWNRDAELNRLFIQCQQNYANNRLIARGHLLLNDVYEMLGLEHTQAGCVVGWIISENGDNYIDFGIFDAYNSRFINGVEPSVILDFNVDGVIYDKI